MSIRGKINYLIRLMPTVWLLSYSCAPLIWANESINNQAKYPIMVPDTGQISCYDTHKKIPCPEPGEPFYGQDGNYSINVPDYELISQDKVEIIIDHTTGLSWQRLPDTVRRIWTDAIDYTDGLELLGYTDWRLPQKKELQTMFSYGSIPAPLLAPPPPQQDHNASDLQPPSVWTLTTRIFPSLSAMSFWLDDKQGTISNKYEKKFVYAVRGSSLTFGKYQDNKDGTVTDSMTGLMWQASEVRAEKWDKALAYCQQLELGNYQDWRLPTIKELSTLVNESRTNPSIDTTFFPATRSAAYWSSTTFNKHPGFAWYINFANGLEYNGGYKGRHYFVRAVRGGVIDTSPTKPSLIPLPTLEEKVPELLPPKSEQPLKPETPVLPDDSDDMDMLEPYPLDPDAQYE